MNLSASKRLYGVALLSLSLPCWSQSILSPSQPEQTVDPQQQMSPGDRNGIDHLPPEVRLAVNTLVANTMNAGHKPGLSLAVVHRGEIVLTTGYGDAVRKQNYGAGDFRANDKSVPVTASTKFEIGSATKSFTATAVMQIYDQPLLIRKPGVKRLDLDAPLSTYLVSNPAIDPSFVFSEQFGSITPRQLLAMAGGIPDNASNTAPWQSIVTLAARTTPLFTPGTNYCYSNPGFMLLGELIQQLTLTDYDQFMQEQVFGPFGMIESRIHSDQTPPGVALGYEWNGHEYVIPEYRSGASSFSSGALLTSASDLALFLKQATNRRRLKASAYDLMWTPAPFYTPRGPSPWGLGWEAAVGVVVPSAPTEPNAGAPYRVYRKDGGLPGYNAQIFIDDLNEVAVAISTNGNTAKDDELASGADPTPNAGSLELLAAEIVKEVAGLQDLNNPPGAGECWVQTFN